ncbi:MAG: superoxide dismutase family protein [Ilumatobacteraceae bacterium]
MKRRITIVVAVAAALTLQLATPASAASTRARGAGQLRDLQVKTDQPTDHATAQVVAVESDGSTTVMLKVQGLDHRAAGMVLGAHVHVGSCVAGDGGAAGPHYKSNGATATAVNEVWLDFVVGANGTARAEATVPFVIPAGGAAAVVIHESQTSIGPLPPAGAAGPRWACLPVQF